jgi:hypothetical protein
VQSNLQIAQILDGGEASRRARFVFLHRGREASALGPAANFSLFAAEMRGLVVTAAVDCSLRTTTTVCNSFIKHGLRLPSIQLLPPPNYKASPKSARQKPGMTVPAELDALRSLASRLFIDHDVEILSPDSLNAFLGRSGSPLSRAILFTKMAKVPITWRAVSFPNCVCLACHTFYS